MGVESCNTVVVCGLPEDVQKAHKKAIKIYNRVLSNVADPDGGSILISEIVDSIVNSRQSFFVAPDGSKDDGWIESDLSDIARKEFLDYLKTKTYCQYVSVCFGGTGDGIEEHIERSRDMDYAGCESDDIEEDLEEEVVIESKNDDVIDGFNSFSEFWEDATKSCKNIYVNGEKADKRKCGDWEYMFDSNIVSYYYDKKDLNIIVGNYYKPEPKPNAFIVVSKYFDFETKKFVWETRTITMIPNYYNEHPAFDPNLNNPTLLTSKKYDIGTPEDFEEYRFKDVNNYQYTLKEFFGENYDLQNLTQVYSPYITLDGKYLYVSESRLAYKKDLNSTFPLREKFNSETDLDVKLEIEAEVDKFINGFFSKRNNQEKRFFYMPDGDKKDSIRKNVMIGIIKNKFSHVFYIQERVAYNPNSKKSIRIGYVVKGVFEK